MFTVVGGAVAGTNRHAVEVALEDHVAYTAHRIGAVDRRGAIGDDLDALHRFNRDRADIHRLHEAAVGHASTIEQRQRGIGPKAAQVRSEEHTSELQSLMRISYAVFSLKTNKQHNN